MKRARAKAIAIKSGADTMNKWLYISLHTAAAASFMFLMQRFFLQGSLESSLIWAAVFGGGAALLAFKQTNR
jgi:hypothetical protein